MYSSAQEYEVPFSSINVRALEVQLNLNGTGANAVFKHCSGKFSEAARRPLAYVRLALFYYFVEPRAR